MNGEQHQKLKELFQQARNLPPEERDAFAVKACGDDTLLREELQALLRHDLTQTLVAQNAPSMDPTSSNPLTDLSILTRPSRLSNVPRVHVAMIASAATLVVILVAGVLLHQSVRQRLLHHNAAQLESQCQSTAMAVIYLLDTNVKLVESWAINPELAAVVERLGHEDLSADKRTLERQLPTLFTNLRQQWGPGFTCVVWNREQTKVLYTANNLDAMMHSTTASGASLLNRVLFGESMVYLPNSLETISQGFRAKPGQKLMSYVVPVRASKTDKIVGAMLLRNDEVEDRFHATFERAPLLRTGESYAFTKDARMISRPRFLNQLKQLGLVETPENLPATMFVLLKDPGGDMTEGYQPAESRAAQPDTELVRRSNVEKSGVIVRGYRDYRGRRTMGAWQWIDRYDFGVALEIDEAELSEPYHALNTAFLAAGGLILIATGWVISSQILTRRRLRMEVRELRRIGPYHLEKQIGEGGMGKVFLAQHDLLKRPTALKILKPELVTETAIRRFTREVQFACQLHHPNTVDIYDYGRTADGQFYYAMEFLFGLSLHELVRTFGPLPYARGLYLMRQLCGSLGEAHRAGFVHRDVKPQNIMICNCGGEADFVKVVDFGLVKSSETPQNSGDTTHGEWAGTPRYIAPERLLQPRLVDPRSDIYSVGVTMYWALTGTDAFDGDGLDGLLTAIMSQAPRPIAPEFAIPDMLQEILTKCLAKVPGDRYQSIEELQAALSFVPNADPWTPDAARLWWQTHLPNLSEVTPCAVPDHTPSVDNSSTV